MAQNLRENQMRRGSNQALYKYLPLSWIDFYKKNDRTSYSAFVKNWNSTLLTDINAHRLLLRIERNIKEFQEYGNTKDFIFPITEKDYEVRTLVPSLNANIITEISPLTFFCGNCKKVHSYNSPESFKRINPKRQCTKCKKLLKQISFVYTCECGFAAPVEPIPCSQHKFEQLYYYDEYKFTCTKNHTKVIEIRKRCPNCKKFLYPKNAYDLANYIPANLTMIDLIDKDMDNFLSEDEDGAKILIAEWFNKIDKETVQHVIQKRSISKKESTKNDIFEKQVSMLIEQFNIPESQAREMAKAMVSVEEHEDDVEKAIKEINEVLNTEHLTNKELLNDLAIQLLEYNTVLEPIPGKEGIVSTLDDAIEISGKLNTNADPSKYIETAKKFGFSKVQASGNIPFILCSYGFTRRETEPNRATLVGFPSESLNKKNVYASKLETEGILFEIDRGKIIKWLLKNNIIDPVIDNVPQDLTNETEVKAWFMNKVNANSIKTFSAIDEESDKITKYVYSLIHSLSHSILRQCANLCGLDKNSLSEYIFPNIPAFLIYCQNSQGLNIGALFNVFEAYFDKLLESTKEEIEKCVFDPVCIDRDHACSGCIYLNEVSCVHFNKDLDRRLIIGWYDKLNDERLYGFWEDY